MKKIMLLFLFLGIGLILAQGQASGEEGEGMMDSGGMDSNSMMDDGMMGGQKGYGLLESELLHILTFLLLVGLVILVYLTIWTKLKEIRKK